MSTNNSWNSNIPVEISKGGTNATSMATTDGVVYYDGTKLVTTAVGSAGQVLTSNGVGNPPTFQAGGGGGSGFSSVVIRASNIAFALPATATVGDILRLTGINTALGWTITQAANQQIFGSTGNTTLGATGTLSSSATRDTVELVCVVGGASSVYNVISQMGNLTYV